ncbi:MAG: alpha-2-macroglobulin, partial [Saprospiraceae bacterium]
WLKRDLYTQAMIGLIMQRNEDNLVQNIVKSLRERSFSNDELGMYWNEGNGFYWYQLPIERHSLMIELFTEAVDNKEESDKMKIWLLKNKQTNHWKTSKSTAAAIYALLLQGEKGDISQWVTESVQPVIMVGNELLNTSITQSESGTGYVKKAWNAESINKEMSTIKVTNNNKSIGWGAAYYQYFEQLDQIKTFADTPLKLNKKLYKVVSTPKGDELTEITENTSLKPGDKLRIRIELRVDREMEYVHMKDMRASGFEPENVISEYKYQGQLGYYETTKDLATHFYFTYLPKGTFVFEYPVRVVHKGDFSGGITNIECMYAPEFSSHSEGARVKVK